MILKNVFKELAGHPFKYFEYEKIVTFEQLSVYRGLSWDTYKYRVSFPDGEYKNIYIKTSKESGNQMKPKKHLELQQHITDSYENLQRVHEGFKKFPDYSSIKPLTCFPEWLTLITEESLGRDVWSIIREKAKFYPSEITLQKLENICQACGKWLALFQQITKNPDCDLYKFDSIIELFDTYLSRLERRQNITFPGKFREKIIDFCQQLVLSIPDEDRIVTEIHGDFAPVNILVHNDEIIVLDIETPKYGPIYWDVTYFHYHLSTLLDVPIYRPTTITRLQEAFMQGCEISLDPSKKVVTLCTIHNVIISLLFLVYHREHVSWYRKLYDRILYKKLICRLRTQGKRILLPPFFT